MATVLYMYITAKPYFKQSRRDNTLVTPGKAGMQWRPQPGVRKAASGVAAARERVLRMADICFRRQMGVACHEVASLRDAGDSVLSVIPHITDFVLMRGY